MTEIQFGVMLIFNMCLGNITPPVGSVLDVYKRQMHRSGPATT